MSSAMVRLVNVSAILALAATSGCSQAGPSKDKPTGEDDLSCAALIFATNSYVKDTGDAAAVDAVKNSYLSAVTSYTNSYAKSEGLDAQEALGRVRLKALSLTGVGDGQRVSSSEIVRRAKACTEAL